MRKGYLLWRRLQTKARVFGIGLMCLALICGCSTVRAPGRDAPHSMREIADHTPTDQRPSGVRLWTDGFREAVAQEEVRQREWEWRRTFSGGRLRMDEFVQSGKVKLTIAYGAGPNRTLDVVTRDPRGVVVNRWRGEPSAWFGKSLEFTGWGSPDDDVANDPFSVPSSRGDEKVTDQSGRDK